MSDNILLNQLWVLFLALDKRADLLSFWTLLLCTMFLWLVWFVERRKVHLALWTATGFYALTRLVELCASLELPMASVVALSTANNVLYFLVGYLALVRSERWPEKGKALWAIYCIALVLLVVAYPAASWTRKLATWQVLMLSVDACVSFLVLAYMARSFYLFFTGRKRTHVPWIGLVLFGAMGLYQLTFLYLEAFGVPATLLPFFKTVGLAVKGGLAGFFSYYAMTSLRGAERFLDQEGAKERQKGPFATLVRAAATMCRGHAAALLLTRDGGATFEVEEVVGSVPKNIRELPPPWGDLARQATRAGPVRLNNTGEHYHASGIAEPLVQGGRVLGALVVTAVKSRRFGPVEEAQLSGVAAAAATAVERHQVSRTLAQLAEELMAADHLDQVASSLIVTLQRELVLPYFGVSLLESGGLREHHVLCEENGVLKEQLLVPQDSELYDVIRTGKPKPLACPDSLPGWTAATGELFAHAFPIATAGGKTGALCIGYAPEKHDDLLNEEQHALISACCAQAAAAASWIQRRQRLADLEQLIARLMGTRTLADCLIVVAQDMVRTLGMGWVRVEADQQGDGTTEHQCAFGTRETDRQNPPRDMDLPLVVGQNGNTRLVGRIKAQLPCALGLYLSEVEERTLHMYCRVASIHLAELMAVGQADEAWEQLQRLGDQVVFEEMLLSRYHDVSKALNTAQEGVEVLSGEVDAKVIEVPREALEHAKDLTTKVLSELKALFRKVHAPSEGADAASVVVDLTRTFTPMFASRELFLTNEITPGLPAMALTEDRLQAVLMALLWNAHDILEPDGRAVIHVQKGEPGRVLIKVEDDGPGIPATDLKQVFQLKYSSKEDGSGHGLGLYVARRIVKNAGGKIWIESTMPDGSGCRVMVELPDGATIKS